MLILSKEVLNKVYPWLPYQDGWGGNYKTLSKDTPKEVVEKYKLFKKVLKGIIAISEEEKIKICKDFIGDFEFWAAQAVAGNEEYSELLKFAKD